MLLTSDVVHCVINDPDTVKVQVKLVSIVITLTSSVKKVKKFTDFRLVHTTFQPTILIGIRHSIHSILLVSIEN